MFTVVRQSRIICSNAQSLSRLVPVSTIVEASSYRVLLVRLQRLDCKVGGHRGLKEERNVESAGAGVKLF